MLTKEEIQAQIDILGPWHYCLEMPYGLTTGECSKETIHPKLQKILDSGALSRPIYTKVLDLGANSGQMSFWLVDNKGSLVDAIEYGPKYYLQLEFAIEMKGYKDRVFPLKIDIHLLDTIAVPNQYDLILFLGTLHHIKPDYHLKVLESCRKMLFPGGELIVQTQKDLDVPLMLKQVGFTNIQVLDSKWDDRWAVQALKDPMKIWD